MILLSTPGFLFLAIAASLAGFAAFAYYKSKDCDPFAADYISNSNEVSAGYTLYTGTLSSGRAREARYKDLRRENGK